MGLDLQAWTNEGALARPVDVAAWTSERRGDGDPPHLVDTTMLFAPRSGGVKRYLLAKRAWFRDHRPRVRHTLLVPGQGAGEIEPGLHTLAAAQIPFADGYRFPALYRRWAEGLVRLRPNVIEAGDPYGPGLGALEAGQRLGVPVIGFCHTDLAALATLHLGNWAEQPARKRWANTFNRFDVVVAPSRHIADRLQWAGVAAVRVQPLGVDTRIFHPDRGDRDGLRRELGLKPGARLLVFAGRAAREKNVNVLLDAVERLGAPYHLVLIGAGAAVQPSPCVSVIEFQRDPQAVARLLASCDALVHANDREPFGLVALEAMASGLPIVSVGSGGLGELVDHEIGQTAERADGAAFAEAIDALFQRDLETVRIAARKRALASHGWDAVFREHATLYASLTGSPSAAIAAVPPALNLVSSTR